MAVARIEELQPGGPDAVRIPLIGQSLCAGFPSPADDFLEGAHELPRWLAPNPPAIFLWRITGDSMRGAGIFDGDLACVDRSLQPPTAVLSARTNAVYRDFARDVEIYSIDVAPPYAPNRSS